VKRASAEEGRSTEGGESDEIELGLGLSLGGRFGTDRSRRGRPGKGGGRPGKGGGRPGKGGGWPGKGGGGGQARTEERVAAGVSGAVSG
jgi:hypothetical protein